MITANTRERSAKKPIAIAQTIESPVVIESIQSAEEAGLRYVTDSRPGIRRVRFGSHFRYMGVDGKPVKDEDTLARIKSLVIPPAWNDVWICPIKNGHLQATGRDARGRKQYRYHPKWRVVRDENKFSKIIRFGKAIPKIRARVAQDLDLPDLPKEKVLAAIVKLLETTLIRVGNEEYARQNNSYGLTTLRNKHVQINGSQLTFRFRGKSGKFAEIDLKNPRLARIVKRCRDIPGQELFQYIDSDGNTRSINSEDVNQYLREISGDDFTAKDFRTWSATVLAALAFNEFESFNSDTEAKKNIVRAVEAVSCMLGNTPAICRKSYIHPAVIDGYLDGSILQTLKKKVSKKLKEEVENLKPEEAAVLSFLQKKLASEAA